MYDAIDAAADLPMVPASPTFNIFSVITLRFLTMLLDLNNDLGETNGWSGRLGLKINSLSCCDSSLYDANASAYCFAHARTSGATPFSAPHSRHSSLVGLLTDTTVMRLMLCAFNISPTPSVELLPVSTTMVSGCVSYGPMRPSLIRG